MLGIAATLAISVLVGAQDALPSLPPDPARPSLLIPLYISLASLQMVDAYQTWDTVGAGGTEVNPVMAPFAGSPSSVLLLKASASAATILFAEHLRRKHPRTAVVFMIALNIGMTAVVYHNVRERAGP